MNISTQPSNLLALCLLVTSFAGVCVAAPNKSIEYSVTGLSAEAEIIVDQYGVPHIYANDHYDVFFVQGF